MVFLFFLLTFWGHVDAHKGWVGHYVKMDASNCHKIQQHYDRREWSRYKTRYNDASNHLGDGDYNPNFQAYTSMKHAMGEIGSLRDVANFIGGSEIENSIASRCSGIKFSTRLGYFYDGKVDSRVLKQYFCFAKSDGFSVVAFQSGRVLSAIPLDPTLVGSDLPYCIEFETVNTEYIEVYTFVTRNEVDFWMAFSSEPFNVVDTSRSDKPITDGLTVFEDGTRFENLFRGVDGYMIVKRSSSPFSDKLAVTVEIEGLVDNAIFGEVGITNLRCVNYDGWLKSTEVFTAGSGQNWVVKAIDNGCGQKWNSARAVKWTAENVATFVCKKPNGECVQPTSATVSYSSLEEWVDSDCYLPDLRDPDWFDEQCCTSLLEEKPAAEFQLVWTGDYFNDDGGSVAEEFRGNWTREGVDFTEPNRDHRQWTDEGIADDLDPRAMKTQAFNAEGDKFMGDIFVGDPLEIKFEYDQHCPMLEVSFKFQSTKSTINFQDVVYFPTYKQPGVFISFTPLNTDTTLKELNDMQYSSEQMMSISPFSQGAFWPYQNINFISNSWGTPNFGLQDITRASHYKLGLRGTLRSDRKLVCSFSVPVSSGKVWFLFEGEKVIDANGKPMNQSNSSQQWGAEFTKPFTLEAGEFYYFDIVYLHYGRPFGHEVTHVSLIWSCTELNGERFTEVVPRRYIYNRGMAGKHGNVMIRSPYGGSHIDMPQSLNNEALPFGHFSIALEHPTGEDTTITCTPPAGYVLTPTVTVFPENDWSSWKWVVIHPKPNFNEDDNPDGAIRCVSKSGEKSIYITPAHGPAQKVSMAAAGRFTNFYWSTNTHFRHEFLQSIRSVLEPHWRHYDALPCAGSVPCDEGGLVFTRLFEYYSPGRMSNSVHIQAMHDTILSSGGESMYPCVGFALNYGPVVFAAYPSLTSVAWKPYLLSKWDSIARNKHLRITEGDGSITLTSAAGLECMIHRVGKRYMDIVCDIPASLTDTSSVWKAAADKRRIKTNFFGQLPFSENLFFFPQQAKHLVQDFEHFTPLWPEDNLPSRPSFTESVIPRPSTGENFNLGCVDDLEEVSFKDREYDFDSPRVWAQIERHGGCPLLDDLYPSLQSLNMNFAFGGNIDMYSMVQNLKNHCADSMHVSKLLSCLGGEYYLNQNDARSSIKNMLWHSTRTLMEISDMIPQNLVQSAESDGHFCHKDGHLVGTPPQCACIANGQYPDCDSSVSCEPSNQCQISVMQSANSVNDDGTPGKLFCDKEKSIVIDELTGHAMYCERGFCTLWENTKSQKGLNLGSNPCETPYCVKWVDTDSDGIRNWSGLTECGTAVHSIDDGLSWQAAEHVDNCSGAQCFDSRQISDSPSGFDHCGEEFCPIGPNDQIWTWSTEEICVTDESSGWPLKYCVKWLCDCLDAEVWANLI